MLTKQSATVGVGLAGILEGSNIKLIPKAGTLVGELTSAVTKNPLFGGVCSSEEDLVDRLMLSSSGTTSSSNGTQFYVPADHDAICDNYIQELASICSAHTSYARAVVNAEVTKYKEAVNLAISEYRHPEPEDLFNVTYSKLPDYYRFGALYDLITSSSNKQDNTKSMRPDVLNFTGVNREEFDLVNYLQTGDIEIDSVISAVVSGYGKEVVNDWALTATELSQDDKMAFIDAALIRYMFYTALMEKNDLPTNCSLVTLKTNCRNNADYYMRELQNAIDSVNAMTKSGFLFNSNPGRGFSFLDETPISLDINEEVFETLAEKGYTIQAIFGYLSTVNSKYTVTANELPEASTCIDEWTKVRTLYAIKLHRQKDSLVKRVLAVEFDKALASVADEEEVKFNKTDSRFAQETRDLGYAYIDSIETSVDINIDEIALDLMAKIRFRYTNAYILLKEMSDIMKMDEKITPMEAALYSNVKYVTDFLLEQCDTSL